MRCIKMKGLLLCSIPKTGHTVSPHWKKTHHHCALMTMSFGLLPNASHAADRLETVDPVTPVIRVALQDAVIEDHPHLDEIRDESGEQPEVNRRSSFQIGVVSGPCYRSPSPNGGRRLSAPVSTGSPSHLRRCSVEEPYVFSVAQAAVAAGQQLLIPQPPASMMITTTERTSPILSPVPDLAKTPDDHQMALASLSPDSMASGCGGPRWEFVAIGGSSFARVIRRPSPKNDEPDAALPSGVEECFRSAVAGDMNSGVLYQQNQRSVVLIDPAPSINDVHSRRTARSMSLTQGQGQGRFDLSTMKSHSISTSDTQAMPTFTGCEFLVSDATVMVPALDESDASGAARDIDFLKLPSEWSTIDDATGLPRRRHSVASGRISSTGQLESIAEESSGAGNSGSGGQCLLKPKGSIRRYSIPEAILAAHASSSSSST
jgi:hypothetical protein